MSHDAVFNGKRHYVQSTTAILAHRTRTILHIVSQINSANYDVSERTELSTAQAASEWKSYLKKQGIDLTLIPNLTARNRLPRSSEQIKAKD